jgi:hypothetical protein
MDEALYLGILGQLPVDKKNDPEMLQTHAILNMDIACEKHLREAGVQELPSLTETEILLYLSKIISNIDKLNLKDKLKGVAAIMLCKDILEQHGKAI